jgi:predicted transposase/invertase (TIGR01784 family)
MKTDSLFYRLFQRFPGLPLELAGLDYAAEGYVFRSEEIKQTAFRLDGILIPPTGSLDRPVVFIEAQIQPDDGFYARFFSEIFLYLRQYNPPHPWQAVVIYPDRTAEKPAGHFADLLQLPRVRRVYLEDLASDERCSPALSLIMLAICPPKQAHDLTRQMLSQAGQLPVDRDEWLDFIETILVYKFPRLSREEIKLMIGLQDIELKQTRFYRDVFSEGEQEGLEKGLEQGELAIVLRVLQRRFGPLPETLRERLGQLERARIEALSDIMLDLPSVVELSAWLERMG